MNRSRTAFAVIAIAAIVFLSLAPAAEARSLRSKPSVSESGGSWLDAAMVWLSGILPGQGDATRTTTEKSKSTDGSYKPIIIGPQYTGSCIDPDGCTCGG
jgi:hypothetical protein